MAGMVDHLWNHKTLCVRVIDLMHLNVSSTGHRIFETTLPTCMQPWNGRQIALQQTSLSSTCALVTFLKRWSTITCGPHVRSLTASSKMVDLQKTRCSGHAWVI